MTNEMYFEETPRNNLSKAKTIAMIFLVTAIYFGFAMTAIGQTEETATAIEDIAAQTATKAEDTSVFRYQPGPLFSYSSTNDFRSAGTRDESLETSTNFFLKSPYLRQYNLSLGARVSGNLSYADGTPEEAQMSDAKYKFAVIRAGTSLLKTASTSIGITADARFYETGILDSYWQSYLSISFNDGPFTAEFYPGVYSRYDRLDVMGGYIETILTYNLNETIGFALYSSEEHGLSPETGTHVEGLFGPALVFNISPALSGNIVVGNNFATEDGETMVRISVGGSL